MLILGVTQGSGFSFQSFVFKEKTKGFTLQSLTQANRYKKTLRFKTEQTTANQLL